jgi:hypothetical protein
MPGVGGAGVPQADRPIAVEFPGYPVVRLRPIDGLEFVEEAVIALGYSTELATHLFRECWAEGTGKHGCPDGGRGSWTSTLVTGGGDIIERIATFSITVQIPAYHS